MWMRIAGATAVAGLAFVLVTCGGDTAMLAGGGDSSETPDPTATATPTPTPSSTPSPTATTPADTLSIACAPKGSTGFDSTCTVERIEVDGVRYLTVFHPDGGFRRFEQLADGSGVAAVAGADKVTQTLSGDILEVSLAGNRYRFPATTR